MKKVLFTIMGAMLIITSMVSCNNNTEVISTERKVELCEEYVTEHNWTDRYDKIEMADSVKSDRYFFIKIYTNGRDYPTLIDTIYYD